MKKRGILISFMAAMALTVSGCKIVENKPKSEAAIPSDQSGDAARNAARLEQTFEAKLLPLIRDGALLPGRLRTLIADDMDAAGAAHGNRGAGQGAAWNFPVRGAGVVIAAKLDTRARWVAVDVNSDGRADVKLQLGPVIRGTALRDVAPFYNFDDFRDQIEFAKLSRALNDRIKLGLTVPEGELMGKTVSFTGVAPFKKPTDDFVVTPVMVEFSK
ncbi:DUF2291 domain-containing protein [Nisaea sp.]|uniref:DUF2291 family protein n=1 Tax=Nisaea sp. TaxID=2024842 RepID=UPI003264889D